MDKNNDLEFIYDLIKNHNTEVLDKIFGDFFTTKIVGIDSSFHIRVLTFYKNNKNNKITTVKYIKEQFPEHIGLKDCKTYLDILINNIKTYENRYKLSILINES